ncbi:MAG: type II toxin-antitoxin system RelE family toxin [Thermoanaerobaculia bacterium]
MFEVELREQVLEEDLPAMPANIRRRVIRAIEARLATDPVQYATRLRQSLHGLWKLRVDDFRVVFALETSRVRVWAIVHRRKA